jgi:hypothetical protein
LADPALYDGVSIVAWEQNAWRDAAAATELTDAALAALARFVRDGGELVMFEQWQAGYMKLFGATFGVRTAAGGGRGGQVADPALAAAAKAAGLADDALADLPFYNTYHDLPEGSRVLVRTKAGSAGVAVVPFGKGRLLLVGLSPDAKEQKVTDVLFGFAYGYKPATREPPPSAR